MVLRDQIIERLRRSRSLSESPRGGTGGAPLPAGTPFRSAFVGEPSRTNPSALNRQLMLENQAMRSVLGEPSGVPRMPHVGEETASLQEALGGSGATFPPRPDLPAGSFVHEDASISEPGAFSDLAGGVSSGFSLGHDPQGNFQAGLRQFEGAAGGGTGGAPLPIGGPFRSRTPRVDNPLTSLGPDFEGLDNPTEVRRISPLISERGFDGGTGGAPLPVHRTDLSRRRQFNRLEDFGSPFRTQDISAAGARGLAPNLFSHELPREGVGQRVAGAIPAPSEGIRVGQEDDEAQLALEAARMAAGVSPLGPAAQPNVRVFGGRLQSRLQRAFDRFRR